MQNPEKYLHMRPVGCSEQDGVSLIFTSDPHPQNEAIEPYHFTKCLGCQIFSHL